MNRESEMQDVVDKAKAAAILGSIKEAAMDIPKESLAGLVTLILAILSVEYPEAYARIVSIVTRGLEKNGSPE